LLALTVANIRSYIRDRAALFWTMAFPLIFIVLFGLIFSAGPSTRLTLGWVDDDGSAASAQLKATFARQLGVTLVETTQQDAIDQMNIGKVDSVVVVPRGYVASLIASGTGTGTGSVPAKVVVYTDPSRPQMAGSVYQVVGNVLWLVNLGGRPQRRSVAGNSSAPTCSCACSSRSTRCRRSCRASRGPSR